MSGRCRPTWPTYVDSYTFGSFGQQISYRCANNTAYSGADMNGYSDAGYYMRLWTGDASPYGHTIWGHGYCGRCV